MAGGPSGEVSAVALVTGHAVPVCLLNMFTPYANAVSSLSREAYSFFILFFKCVWMSCLYELRIEPGSSGRAASALNSWPQSVAPWGFALEVGTDHCRDSKLVNDRLLKAELHLGCLTPSPQLREYHRKHMVLRNTFFLAWHGHYTIELPALWLSAQTCSGLSPQWPIMEGIVRPHSSCECKCSSRFPEEDETLFSVV